MATTQAYALQLIAAIKAYREAYESLASALKDAQNATTSQAKEDIYLAALYQIPHQRIDLMPHSLLADSEARRIHAASGKARRERNRQGRKRAAKRGDYLWEPSQAREPTYSRAGNHPISQAPDGATLDDASLAKLAAEMKVDFNLGNTGLSIPSNAPSFDPLDAKPFTPPDMGFLKRKGQEPT